jgi:tetratricopeptide (TPR) repeat protein
MELARDLDALAVRADSRINAVIREAAARHAGVALVDAVTLLDAQSPGGMPGRELFYEHVHFTLPGNYQLARIFADRVAAALPPVVQLADRGQWAGHGACLRRLAVTLWDNHRLWTDIHARLSVPPYSNRATTAANLAYAAEQAEAARARMDPRMDRQIYELATAALPDDYHLRNRYGHFLQEHELLDEAIAQFQWISDTFPDFEGGHQDLGIALFLAGRTAEAEASFRRVLAVNPHYSKARQALELVDRE